MSVSATLDALRDALPEGLPLSLVGIAATIIIGVLYSVVTQERPLAGFPLASLEGKGPKKSWLFHGRQLVSEGTQKVLETQPILLQHNVVNRAYSTLELSRL